MPNHSNRSTKLNSFDTYDLNLHLILAIECNDLGLKFLSFTELDEEPVQEDVAVHENTHGYAGG